VLSSPTKGDFLEIAALRRILISGVSVTRHVMGLVHPISIFSTKNFDGIFWYHRTAAGVHQYDFKHLIDVSTCRSAFFFASPWHFPGADRHSEPAAARSSRATDTAAARELKPNPYRPLPRYHHYRR